ncbi:Methionine adenosyltransferase 2 subunit beta [Linum grandiflorum]
MATEKTTAKVLVVGGTGYLGQHLLEALSKIGGDEAVSYDLAFTYHSDPSPPQALLAAVPHCLAFRVDLRTGDGFDAVSRRFGQDPDAAMAINVPSALVNWLDKDAFLIHLSTDQVYEGVKAFYKEEEDEAAPVNVYGKSKMAAEKFIAEKCSNFAILRSSIIYGPQTVSPVPKSLPVQWMDGVLSKGEPVEFFHDEFRCPVYVKDVVNVILALINQRVSEGKQIQLLLNLGGPDRLSRVEMAEVVADVIGHDTCLIKRVSASSVDRGVRSPADISMDVSKLVKELGIRPTPFKDGVKFTLHSA